MIEGKQNPDQLLEGGANAAVELTEADLDTTAGGVKKDKVATANKSADATKGLL